MTNVHDLNFELGIIKATLVIDRHGNYMEFHLESRGAIWRVVFNVTWRGTWTRSANKDAIGGISEKAACLAVRTAWPPQGSANEYRRENEGSERKESQ